MSALWTKIKSWFVKKAPAVAPAVAPVVSDVEALWAKVQPELATLRSHIDAMFTVLRAEIQKSPAAPAAPVAAPAAPVAQDLVAAKNAELDTTIMTATEQKAAIKAAVDNLTKAIGGQK